MPRLVAARNRPPARSGSVTYLEQPPAIPQSRDYPPAARVPWGTALGAVGRTDPVRQSLSSQDTGVNRARCFVASGRRNVLRPARTMHSTFTRPRLGLHPAATVACVRTSASRHSSWNSMVAIEPAYRQQKRRDTVPAFNRVTDTALHHSTLFTLLPSSRSPVYPLSHESNRTGRGERI